MPNWNRENIILLTVTLPATKAPSKPTRGANKGQLGPTSSAIPAASVRGILRRSAVPELIKTRAISTDPPKARATITIMGKAWRAALRNTRKGWRCSQSVRRATTKIRVGGRCSGWSVTLRLVSKSPNQRNCTERRAAWTGAMTRERTRITPVRA